MNHGQNSAVVGEGPVIFEIDFPFRHREEGFDDEFRTVLVCSRAQSAAQLDDFLAVEPDREGLRLDGSLLVGQLHKLI